MLSDSRLLDFEAGDTTGQLYAVALDVGTTTLVGALLDLNTGAELAVASGMNPQVCFGDDVLSRIAHASQGPGQLAQLRETLLEEIERILAELCEKAGVAREHIYEMVCAGNTTMESLLCGINREAVGAGAVCPGM